MRIIDEMKPHIDNKPFPPYWKISLLLVPFLFIVISNYSRNLQGPYYGSFVFDPSYAYLLNALNIAENKRPGHIHHPGTTVHIIGGLVLKLNHLKDRIYNESTDFAETVLLKPEAHIRNINYVMIFLVAIAVTIFGFQACKFSGSILVAVVAQAFPLSFPVLIEQLPKLTPEPLLVVCSFILAALLISLLNHSRRSEFNLNKIAIATGVLIGFGMVTKITFAPLALSILIFQGIKPKLFAIISSLVTIIFLTIPIWDRYPQMFHWFLGILIHAGNYGHGAIGLPPLESLWFNFSELWSQVPVLLCFIPLLLISYISAKKIGQTNKCRALLVCLLILLCQVGMVIKHPGTKYALPTLTFCSFFLFLFILSFSRMINTLLVYLLVFVTTILIVYSVNLTNVRSTRLSRIDKANAELRRIAVSHDCTIIDSYRISSKEYALQFGNNFSRRAHSFILDKLYPEYMSFNVFGNYFEAFNGSLSISKLMKLTGNSIDICTIGTYSLPLTNKNNPKKMNVLGNIDAIYLHRLEDWTSYAR